MRGTGTLCRNGITSEHAHRHTCMLEAINQASEEKNVQALLSLAAGARGRVRRRHMTVNSESLSLLLSSKALFLVRLYKFSPFVQ